MKFVEYPEDKKTDSPKETEGQTRGGWFPNGNIFWTMVLMFAFLALINTFLFPGSRGSSVVETDYGTFISDVDKGLVYDVVMMEIRCYIQRVLRSHIRKNSKGRETRPMSPARSRIRIS